MKRRLLWFVGLLATGALTLTACGSGGTGSNGTTYWRGNYSNTTAYWSVTINGNNLAGWQSSRGGGYSGTQYHLSGHENADNTWTVGDESGNSYLLTFTGGEMYVKDENSNYAAVGYHSISQAQYDDDTDKSG